MPLGRLTLERNILEDTDRVGYLILRRNHDPSREDGLAFAKAILSAAFQRTIAFSVCHLFYYP